MADYDYIKKFEKLGFGLFVHFGIYSVHGEGEWAQKVNNIPKETYEKLPLRFNIKIDWADELCLTAKEAGAKYITLTARHHDGFSLFDTCGLSQYDSVHSTSKRDLIAEFVSACRKYGLVPFFYHTLIDWHNTDYENNFTSYIDYLVESVRLLCCNYGKIGGIWFDGMWDKPNEDWCEDRLYGMIRKHQPDAMIINNTGLSELGKVGHPEIDSVTFERGKPAFVDNSDRDRAGEMCQVLNDHWGYAKEDCNYKSVKELIENLVDCRRHNCNFLLNTGLMGDGSVKVIDKCILQEVGSWIKANQDFIYDVKSCDIIADNAFILKNSDYYYAVIKDVVMTADPNVTKAGVIKHISIKSNLKLKSVTWLDSGQEVPHENNSFYAEPFNYGTSRSIRVAKLTLCENND